MSAFGGDDGERNLLGKFDSDFSAEVCSFCSGCGCSCWISSLDSVTGSRNSLAGYSTLGVASWDFSKGSISSVWSKSEPVGNTSAGLTWGLITFKVAVDVALEEESLKKFRNLEVNFLSSVACCWGNGGGVGWLVWLAITGLVFVGDESASTVGDLVSCRNASSGSAASWVFEVK